ncbi:MAG: CPBP family intramembrane glutamic endopeptidase [Chloroherpetonaceae bacterium]|nr:CPBP family intramembrane metalloprotease [Chthonomonadaceae bacterium]MDW8206343.1 CPBP family intramembrane glutamic endopeptidase [Chloroherpetonaceae bacterium]
MLPQNPAELNLLVLGLILAVLVVLTIDLCLILRWIRYQRRLARAIRQHDAPPATPGLEATPAPDPVPYIPPPFAPTWSLVHPFLAFQFVVVVANLLALILALFLLPWVPGGITALTLTNSPGMVWLTGATVIVALWIQNGLFIGATAYYLRRYGTSLQQIGMSQPTSRHIALGVMLGICLFCLGLAAESALTALLPRLLSPGQAERLKHLGHSISATTWFLQMPGTGMKLLFALAGTLAAPIGEEVFFRGFVYNALKVRLGMAPAIVLSALAFALIHASPIAIVVIFPMGMALAYLYARTGSLWVTILIHAVNNGLSFIALALFPQLGQ